MVEVGLGFSGLVELLCMVARLFEYLIELLSRCRVVFYSGNVWFD